jgi:deoxyribodipyrimidine photo-lyase
VNVTIALFTRDLRIRDNPVLAAAQRAGDAVVPLFVLDEAILSSRFNTPNRAHFVAAALAELDDELRGAGGRLVIRRGTLGDEVERVVTDLAATQVHVAADVSGYSARREQQLRGRLARQHCVLHTHPRTITMVEPGALAPSTGRDNFAVFTPYFRRWRAAARRRPLGRPRALAVPPIRGDALPQPAQICRGAASPQLAVGGETTGRRLLHRWLSGPIHDYHRLHDDLAADATSRLSPYLHFGCLSPTEIIDRTDPCTPGGEAFVRQLAWRDFHHQVLAAHPESATADYRTHHDRWHDDPGAAQAWRDAATGYPIVDAGLRQLRAQGWMHNRARLITASFLTKTLYLDWRIGAAHFQHWLVDADLANNNLNWQWAAGTGTDTRPNRVLNPLRQAQRYDPHGAYVRRWIPELAHLPAAAIHTPWTHPGAVPATYPAPIVNHLDGTNHFLATRKSPPEHKHSEPRRRGSAAISG